MKVDKDQKRLKAIKRKRVFFPTKCECCEEEYVGEKMWQFYRYGVNAIPYKWHFCQNCMKTAEDVLHEIDTDEVPFGLAGVDDFDRFRKKDYTRMNQARERAFRVSNL